MSGCAVKSKHTLAIDIESYSAADLSEVGVHRYVEDPTFEVLLIAYSVDDGPVIVIDEKTLSNEDLERRIEFFNLLVDPAVTKYADRKSTRLNSSHQI